MPDDETVNQMIARSEEEFEQFMVRLISCAVIRSLAILQIESSTNFVLHYSSAWILTDAARKPATPRGNLV